MRSGDWKILATLLAGGKRLGKMTNVYAGNEQTILNATLADFELYRVRGDISEARELSKEFPQQLADMTEILQHRYAELIKNSFVWQR